MRIVTPARGRAFVALLALAAALLLAAACSNDSGGNKTPATGQTPDADQTPATGQTPAAGQTPSGGATAEIKMVAGTAFDKDELTIPADTQVTITADNTDGFHSFAVFESQDAAEGGEDPIAETETCSAPCKRTVEVTLSPGEHYFRCQVHTTAMTGTITAE